MLCLMRAFYAVMAAILMTVGLMDALTRMVSDRVEAMFDERFVRTWRMYLVSSIASFRTGGCQLFQIAFSRAGNNEIPWTRAEFYAAAPAEA